MKKYIPYPTRDAIKNYFPLPNEIFDFGLHSTAIAIYAYLILVLREVEKNGDTVARMEQ